MQRSYFFNDQRVLADDLNNIEGSASQSVRRVLTSALAGASVYGSGSVVGQPGSVALLCTKTGGTTFIVQPGMAIDYSGEFVSINTSPYLSVDQTALPSNITWTSLGSPATYYIKLAYQEASGSVKTNDVGSSYATRYTESYKMIISEAIPTTTQIGLGSFSGDGTGAITGASINDIRPFIRAKAFDNTTYLQASPVAQHTTVYDHVLAHGTGVQTTTNPHGMTLTDLGYNSSSTDQHWARAHAPGILLTDDRYAAGAQDSFKASVVPSGYAYLSFAASNGGAVLQIDTAVVTGSLPNLPSNDASAPSAASYYAVATATASVYWIPAATYPYDPNNPRKYPFGNVVLLARATVDPVAGNITNLTDLRQFYGTETSDIRANSSELSTTSPYANPTSSLGYNATLEDELARIRYQLGTLAGSSWDAKPSASVANLWLSDPSVVVIGDDMLWSSYGMVPVAGGNYGNFPYGSLGSSTYYTGGPAGWWVSVSSGSVLTGVMSGSIVDGLWSGHPGVKELHIASVPPLLSKCQSSMMTGSPPWNDGNCTGQFSFVTNLFETGIIGSYLRCAIGYRKHTDPLDNANARGVYFESDNSGINWRAVVSDGSTIHNLDTGVAIIPLVGTWAKHSIAWDGTNFLFSINNSLVATIAKGAISPFLAPGGELGVGVSIAGVSSFTLGSAAIAVDLFSARYVTSRT